MAEVIADPETDPSATYAVDPARVRVLAARVVASGDGGEEVTHTPMTGAPLAVLPLSSARDVGDGARHGGVDAEGAPGGVGRPAAEPDEDARGSRAHEVQRRGV